MYEDAELSLEDIYMSWATTVRAGKRFPLTKAQHLDTGIRALDTPLLQVLHLPNSDLHARDYPALARLHRIPSAIVAHYAHPGASKGEIGN